MENTVRGNLIDCLARGLAYSNNDEPIEEFIDQSAAYDNKFFADIIRRQDGGYNLKTGLPAYDSTAMENVVNTAFDNNEVDNIPDSVKMFLQKNVDQKTYDDILDAILMKRERKVRHLPNSIGELISQSQNVMADLIEANPRIPIMWYLKTPGSSLFDYFIRRILTTFSNKELLNVVQRMEKYDKPNRFVKNCLQTKKGGNDGKSALVVAESKRQNNGYDDSNYYYDDSGEYYDNSGEYYYDDEDKNDGKEEYNGQPPSWLWADVDYSSHQAHPRSSHPSQQIGARPTDKQVGEFRKVEHKKRMDDLMRILKSV
jgi:hypothetical protein